MTIKRRKFIKNTAFTLVGASAFGLSGCGADATKQATPEKPVHEKVVKASPLFGISLAQWSLHKAHFADEMTALDFAKRAKNEFGINAVEYVNAFFKDKAKDQSYLNELKSRAEGEGVESLLIMIDGEGYLGDQDAAARKTAIENHYKWVEAAKFLGCHSIRVNAHGEAAAKDVQWASIDSLHQLATFAKDFDINVIVENHGSHSSNGSWLAGVIRRVNLPNCGTLPDFGNFCIKRDDNPEWNKKICLDEYDRYKGVKEMMPYAKAVSAKTNFFDELGNETQTDYRKMMKIVVKAGYSGYVGIEYEGSDLSEAEGIMATKRLLEKVRAELAG